MVSELGLYRIRDLAPVHAKGSILELLNHHTPFEKS